MNWLTKVLGLDRRAPVDETRRKILKTAAASPIIIPVLSGPLENINRPASDKSNMLDFMEDVLVITILKDERERRDTVKVWMSVNGQSVLAPLNEQFYIQRKYVELLVNTPHSTGIDPDTWQIISTMRFPFTIHHDPAGDLGTVWMDNILARAA